MNLRTLTILGIDPGYDRVGWAVVERNPQHQIQLKNYGSILTNKKQPLFQRYHQIDTELQKIVDTFQPLHASVESLFFARNQKTAMHVSEARGVILSTLFRNGVAFFEYTPMQIKSATTGNGHADKPAVERMLRLQFPLESGKILDDVMDAIAIAITHAATVRT